MQRQLEVMAKKGESLDNLRQRRNSAHQKAEETAHQLNKMSQDNKYYSMHAEALKRLRKDVRKMEEDIRLEETILIDHKQTATKVWMRLKFGGLYECCEKGSVSNLLVPISFFFTFKKKNYFHSRLQANMENWSLP